MPNLRELPVASLVALALTIVVSSFAVPVERSSAEEDAKVGAAEEATVVVTVDPGQDAASISSEYGAEPVMEADAVQSSAVVTAPTDAIDDLAADPRVSAVLQRGQATVQSTLASSVPHVGAPVPWAAGHRGAGKVIAVIDTGVDPDFGGTIVGSACFAATQRTGGLQSHCGPVDHDGDPGTAPAFVESTFSGLCFERGVCHDGEEHLQDTAGAPCSTSQACSHGSAVAAVAARHEPTPGVAPDAAVYAIRVFNPSGSSADLVDLYLALLHVFAMKVGGVDIAAVNLSVATATLYSGVCDHPSVEGGAGPQIAELLADLRAVGVPAAIASGNSGSSTRLAFPACLSAGIAVGATDLDDDVAAFSNRGPGLDLLAPGAAEASASPSTGLTIPSGTGFNSWAGTSFAAPHVAGALALMSQVYPQANATQLARFLQTTGAAVGSWRRLQLRTPESALVAGVLFPADSPIGGSARMATGDLDGDGRADVLVHDPVGADRVAYGTPGYQLDVRAMTVSGSYVALVGDFTGAASGADDIVWYAPGTAADGLWAGQSGRTFTKSSLVIDGSFAPVVGDFDADGWDDILWYARGSAADAISYGGSSGFTTIGESLGGTYRVAVGDLDGDGRDDLFFHAPGAAADGLWLGRPGRSFAKVGMSISGSYTLVVLDENGDGADDMLLYQAGSGADFLLLGGPGVGNPAASLAGFDDLSLTVNGSYRVAVGDVDDDGRDDVLWHAPGPAADGIWFGRASGPPAPRGVVVAGSYVPVAADLDGAAGDELVFFNPAALTTPVWWSYEAPP